MTMNGTIRKVWHMALPRGWRVYLSNCPMKARTPATKSQRKEHCLRNHGQRHKASIYEEHGGCCEMCGTAMKQRQLQLHHVLPLERYPELASRRENLMLLCPKCHDEVHKNPFLNSRLMTAAASKFDIDLTEKYND